QGDIAQDHENDSIAINVDSYCNDEAAVNDNCNTFNELPVVVLHRCEHADGDNEAVMSSLAQHSVERINHYFIYVNAARFV
ncbi:MAG: hypothetical protein PVG12_06610, partial [Gammaproteobacteria bacterium]